jgi:hypothetical protein
MLWPGSSANDELCGRSGDGRAAQRVPTGAEGRNRWIEAETEYSVVCGGMHGP